MHIEVPPRRRAAIGLTPLIDVVFILLVFFMLASSFLDWRAVDLGIGGGSPAEGPPPTVVRVDAGGALYHEGERVAPDALGRRLRQSRADGGTGRVLVRPDADAPTGAAVAALDALSGAGISDLGLTAPAAAED